MQAEIAKAKGGQSLMAAHMPRFAFASVHPFVLGDALPSIWNR